MNEFFGKGCWKSFFHVVRFGFEYAPVNLFDAKSDAGREKGRGRQQSWTSEIANTRTYLVI